MRVLFAVWPATAHLHPSVSLAWAMRAAGHDVCIASTGVVAAEINATGMPAVAVGDPAELPIPMGPGNPDLRRPAEEMAYLADVLALDNPTDTFAWEYFRQFMLPCIWNFHPADELTAARHSGVDDLVRFARGWQPDLVVWDPCWPSAPVAARACGAASARLLWGQDTFAWVRDRWERMRALPGSTLGEDPVTGYVRPVAERYGFEVDDALRFGDWTIDPAPVGMRLPTNRPRLSMRWLPYNGASAVPSWLHEPPKRPRIALCLGASMRQFGKNAPDLMAAIDALIGQFFEAVADLDVELAATLNADQLAGRSHIPDNVRTVDYIPLDQLLPSCSALVHHGGVGTWAAAVPYKVPQIIPVEKWGIESPVTGPYMADRGAGLALDRTRLSVADLREQLVEVVENPSYRDGAVKVYEEWLGTPSPHDLVPVLEELTAHHRQRA